MNANIQTITLDLTNSAYSAAQKVFVVQGDSGTRPVKAVITDNGMVRTDLSHESVCLYIDNNGDRPTYVEGISVVNGVAEFNIPQSAVLNAGTVRAELRFVDEENRVLTSVSFVVEVGASVYDENALLGTDDGDVLIRMVEQTRKSAAAAAESAAEAEKTADNLVGRVDAAIEELTDAKERGEFDGSDGISVTHQWNGTELTVTSASGTSSADLKGDKGDKGDSYILTEDDKNEIATKANAVSYSEAQELTDEQKATARENINAVDASKIINAENYSGAPDDSVYDKSAIQQFALRNTVTVIPSQTLTDRKKQIGRRNIDVDGGKWELLYTIEGDGETKVWEFTEYADGEPLKLTAVSAVVIQDVAEAENSYGFLNAYSGDNMTQVAGAIYSYFTKNTAPTESGTQRAYAVIEQHRGQYRGYSSGMVTKNAEVLRYASYTQAKYTTADYPYIDRIKVQKQTGVFSVGNKIEVYGVRYYE